MEAGGQFGGQAHTAWFFPKRVSSTGSTWICIQTTCYRQFANMCMKIGALPILQLHHFLIKSCFQLHDGVVYDWIMVAPCRSNLFGTLTPGRNCEDIAMSFLVANHSGAPPIWVQGE